MKTTPLKPLSLALAVVLLVQNLALAHAFLDHAEPKVGATVATPPKEVRVWFTQEIEPAFSTIQVFDSDQKQVDKKDSRRDEKEKTLLIVSVPQLPAGTYHVHWRVTSVDTHVTEGHFKFTVKPPEK